MVVDRNVLHIIDYFFYVLNLVIAHVRNNANTHLICSTAYIMHMYYAHIFFHRIYFFTELFIYIKTRNNHNTERIVS